MESHLQQHGIEVALNKGAYFNSAEGASLSSARFITIFKLIRVSSFLQFHYHISLGGNFQ